MKVLVLSNGNLEEKEIKNTLENLQKIVDGYIEIPFISQILYENGIDVIINEEGKFIDGMKPEITILRKGTIQILDVVYGNCIFASHDEEGNTTSLNEEQIELVKKMLRTELELTNKNRVCFVTKVLFV